MEHPEKPRWSHDLIETLLESQLQFWQQALLAATLLGATFLAGLGLRSEAHFTPVMLCFAVSSLLGLFTSLPLTVFSALLASLISDLFFVEPIGVVNWDWHLVLRSLIFLFTSVALNLLVNRLRQSSLDAKAAMRRAQELNREKDELLAVLSHDLRGPLSAVMLLLQMVERSIRKNEIQPSALLQLESARRSCKRLNAMILNLLDSAKVDAGGLVLCPEKTDIVRVASELVAELRPAADQAGLTLSICLPPQPLLVNCDRQRVEQLIANLVSNSLKFTPRGGTIELSLATSGGCVQIVVRDNGIGMSRDQINHMYQRFWQAQGGERRGVGLGLYIVKAIVDAHKGTIEVRSSPGEGTTFEVNLPNLLAQGQAESRNASA